MNRDITGLVVLAAVVGVWYITMDNCFSLKPKINLRKYL